MGRRTRKTRSQHVPPDDAPFLFEEKELPAVGKVEKNHFGQGRNRRARVSVKTDQFITFLGRLNNPKLFDDSQRSNVTSAPVSSSIGMSDFAAPF